MEVEGHEMFMADEEGGGGGGGLKRLDWTTWDELLLACAVERHGSKDWDLVSVELRTRSSLPLTAQTCKAKFIDLNRRFMNDGNDVTRSYSSSVPWIEDLRKLRVAELQQEVHRRDLSIRKLQLKVKRLKEEEEERDRELKESGDDDEKPDLRDGSHEVASENNKPVYVGIREGTSATAVRDGSDRENLSFNESNSSQNRSREDEPADNGVEPVDNGVEPNPVTSDSKPAGDDSFNDSSDTIAKHAPPASKPNRTAFPESTTNSKKANKDNNSDLQSSASLSKKRRRTGNEPIVSPATVKREAANSEPLVAFLEVIRSHKHGSLFERRFENQKNVGYNQMVRQHIDLDTIRRKVAAKSSSYHSSDGYKFYRDLLLLFTNFITFFPKSSKESLAAIELRSLVLNEISDKMKSLRKPGLQNDSDGQPEPEKPNASLLTKTRPASAPIVVCRKRSSISAGKSTSVKDIRDEDGPRKAKSKEMPVTGTRSMRKGTKNRATSKPAPSTDKSNVTPSSPEPERKKKGGEQQQLKISSSRKKGAADFLKRIKDSSSPAKATNSTLLERLRNDDAASKKKAVVGKKTKDRESSPTSKKPAGGKPQPVKRGKETAKSGGGGSGVSSTKRKREEGDSAPSNSAKRRRPKGNK